MERPYPPLLLYRFPFSTNVERVALALAHKKLEVESVWVDAADRSEVVRISGQELVPVLVDGDRVVPTRRRSSTATRSASTVATRGSRAGSGGSTLSRAHREEDAPLPRRVVSDDERSS